jgi:kinesin family member 2/24
MDQFYLKNVARYQALLKALPPAPEAGKGVTHAETSAPNMIVSARVRPILDEDVAAGLPRAIFSRSSDGEVLDLHDLYNHPRGQPVLKVRENQDQNGLHRPERVCEVS